jgi:outer membrane protein OmpA-like peptidoglycan-associated protein
MTAPDREEIPMIVRLSVLLAALAFTASPGVAQTLEKARSLYEQAQAASDPATRISLLESSLAEHETFEARLALGDALLAAGQPVPAREQFKRSIDVAADDRARARGTFMVAETFLAESNPASARPMLERAAQLHPYPVVIERLKSLERRTLDQPLSADEITRALSDEATRAFGVKPAVNLRIGFALNASALDDAGLRQARELGKALAGMGSPQFEVIGHTDKQGDAEYNRSLSLERAQAVRDLLVKEFGIDGAAVSVAGKGETQLLYPGDEPEDHALNRRVEIALR